MQCVTHPPCGAHTFPPHLLLKGKSDGKGTLWNQKMPRWGVFPQGCGRLVRPSHERRTDFLSFGLRSPQKGIHRSIRRNGKENGDGAVPTAMGKTLLAFFMSALCAQKKRTIFRLIFPCGGRENQRGIPPSADGGQPARLDRAGPRARTRLSPAGGMGAPQVESCGRELGELRPAHLHFPPIVL